MKIKYTHGKSDVIPPVQAIKSMWIELLWFQWADFFFHEMYPWALPIEIRPYLGWNFTSMPRGIVEVQNLGGHFPKSAFALWQVRINNCIFFAQFSLIVLIMPRPTLIGVRHEVFALAREGLQHSAIAGRIGLTRATVNIILQSHASTGT